MQGQILQTSNTAPSVDLFFFDADGLPLTTLAHNTAGLTIQYARGTAAPVSITLVTQTPTGAYAAGGFCHVAGGKYRLDLPVAATASGLAQVTILASALPTGARSAPFVVALTPDDVTVAGPTAASVATAVWASSTRTLSSFGTLVADMAAAVWSAATRTLTSAGSGGATAAEVWAHATRTLTRGAAPSTNDIAAAVATYLASPDGAAARAAIAEAGAITIVGGGDLRFDDTTGTSLVVQRKSNSATVATIPLRRGDRTQAVVGNG